MEVPNGTYLQTRLGQKPDFTSLSADLPTPLILYWK